MFELMEMAALKHKVVVLEERIKDLDEELVEVKASWYKLKDVRDWHLQMTKILKRALLIACNGDTVKVIECIDRTINEPENPYGR
jgi:hypothetical protein